MVQKYYSHFFYLKIISAPFVYNIISKIFFQLFLVLSIYRYLFRKLCRKAYYGQFDNTDLILRFSNILSLPKFHKFLAYYCILRLFMHKIFLVMISISDSLLFNLQFYLIDYLHYYLPIFYSLIFLRMKNCNIIFYISRKIN